MNIIIIIFCHIQLQPEFHPYYFSNQLLSSTDGATGQRHFSKQLPADLPIVMFTISTAAGRISSSTIVLYEASYILPFYVPPCKMLAKLCFVLMHAYQNYSFVDLILLTLLQSSHKVY